MKLLKPASLKPNDTVAVIAPSEPIEKHHLERIRHFFEHQGYKVKFGKNILAKYGDYAAGTPEQRVDDLNWAFSDPEVKAIFTAQGGMTASQMLDKIDFENIKKNPKIFAGYSDATTLQLAILAKTGLVTFHSPNALSLSDFRPGGYTMTNFWRVLTTDGVGLIKPQSVWQKIRLGKAEGVLFGGNLGCLCKLIGTPWDPIAASVDLFGKETKYIFFWEEVYEQFSEIMRNLWQVRNTGFFERVSAMVVGKLTSVEELDYKDFPPKKELIQQATEPFNFPVLYGVDFGHQVPKATIPIGVNAKIDTATDLWEILEPGVSA